MGWILKMILYGLVIYFLLKTIGSFIYRIMGGQVHQDQQRQTTQHKREGEINIDYIPKDERGRRRGGSKEGDYIDYEEIK